MNFLIAGGTTAAYVYSVVLVILAISTKAVSTTSRHDTPLDFVFHAVFTLKAAHTASRYCTLHYIPPPPPPKVVRRQPTSITSFSTSSLFRDKHSLDGNGEDDQGDVIDVGCRHTALGGGGGGTYCNIMRSNVMRYVLPWKRFCVTYRIYAWGSTYRIKLLCIILQDVPHPNLRRYDGSLRPQRHPRHFHQSCTFDATSRHVTGFRVSYRIYSQGSTYRITSLCMII